MFFFQMTLARYQWISYTVKAFSFYIRYPIVARVLGLAAVRPFGQVSARAKVSCIQAFSFITYLFLKNYPICPHVNYVRTRSFCMNAFQLYTLCILKTSFADSV